jgi:hypothetical protein
MLWGVIQALHRHVGATNGMLEEHAVAMMLDRLNKACAASATQLPFSARERSTRRHRAGVVQPAVAVVSATADYHEGDCQQLDLIRCNERELSIVSFTGAGCSLIWRLHDTKSCCLSAPDLYRIGEMVAALARRMCQNQTHIRKYSCPADRSKGARTTSTVMCPPALARTDKRQLQFVLKGRAVNALWHMSVVSVGYASTSCIQPRQRPLVKHWRRSMEEQELVEPET